MSIFVACVLAVGAGVLSTLQGPANSALARRTSLLAATFIAAIGTAVILGVLLVALRELGALEASLDAPWWAWTPGVLGAVALVIIVVQIRIVGLAASTATIVCSSLIASLALDAGGLLALPVKPLTGTRAVGAALLIVGVLLVLDLRPQKGGSEIEPAGERSSEEDEDRSQRERAHAEQPHHRHGSTLDAHPPEVVDD